MAELRRPPAIESYGAGGFRVEGVRLEGPILILADTAGPWSGQVTPEGLAHVVAAGPAAVECLILGVGRAMSPPPRALGAALQSAGIGLETLTTPEAVRLYNLLARDGRRVAAALLDV